MLKSAGEVIQELTSELESLRSELESLRAGGGARDYRKEMFIATYTFAGDLRGVPRLPFARGALEEFDKVFPQ